MEQGRCFCDGFAALLLSSHLSDTNSTDDIASKIHASVLSEAPAACGFTPTYGSTCPAAQFTVPAEEEFETLSYIERAKLLDLLDFETSFAQKIDPDFSPLTYVSASTFYSSEPTTQIRGLMLSNGGMILSELEGNGIVQGDRINSSLIILSPPLLRDQGISLSRSVPDGQVSLEYTTFNAENTSSNYRVFAEISDASGSTFLDST